MKPLKIFGFAVYISTVMAVAGFCNPAPTLPDPGTRSTTLFTRITGDYGPRNFTGQTSGNTNPHVGIDYGIAGGGRGHAVLGGNITAISPTGDNALIQVADDWEYIHMQVAGPYVTVSPHDSGTVLVFRNGLNQPVEQVLGVAKASRNWLDYWDSVSQLLTPVGFSPVFAGF